MERPNDALKTRQWNGPRVPVTWPRVLAVFALFAVTVVVARTCQGQQVRISQDRAIATARAQTDFTPKRTQIRLVRQGINSHPFWAVSLSIPKPGGDGYTRVTTVRIDANTGKVAAVNNQRDVAEKGPTPSPPASGP